MKSKHAKKSETKETRNSESHGMDFLAGSNRTPLDSDEKTWSPSQMETDVAASNTEKPKVTEFQVNEGVFKNPERKLNGGRESRDEKKS